MSAICGIRRFETGVVARADLDALLGAMSAFGPEAVAWAPESPEAPVALGCRPFRVTPEDEYYHPPLFSADRQVVVVADARIDNREELARELGLRPADWVNAPDAAYLLAAYEAWGTGCAPRLVGDFAFLLWDARRQLLFGARDALGLRVLFYHVSPRRIALATQARALLALGDVPARLNERKIAESLLLFQNPENSFFADVNRLPRGHTLSATAEGVRLERYWSPLPIRKLALRTDREYLEGFTERFDQAVLARLRCQGSVGVLLSGGLDSTAVAASAARQLGVQGRRLRAYHAAPRLGFHGEIGPGMLADESAMVEEFAGWYPNLDLTIYRTDERTPLSEAETRFAHTGLPPRNSGNMGWFDATYSLAWSNGVRVLLCGDQGNNVMSYDGRRLLLELARRGRWLALWHETSALARETADGRREVLRKQVLRPLLPSWKGRQVRRRAALDLLTRYSAIRPDFALAMEVADDFATRHEEFRAGRASSLSHRVTGLLATGDSADVLSGYRAWFGIETRDPTSDRRVVEYCLALPTDQFMREGRTRWLVRRAMAGQVPERILGRATYGGQAVDWSEQLPSLRPVMVAELADAERSTLAQRCIDLPRLRGLLNDWPSQFGPQHQMAYWHVLLQGVMMGRFIRWFERTYA